MKTPMRLRICTIQMHWILKMQVALSPIKIITIITTIIISSLPITWSIKLTRHKTTWRHWLRVERHIQVGDSSKCPQLFPIINYLWHDLHPGLIEGQAMGRAIKLYLVVGRIKVKSTRQHCFPRKSSFLNYSLTRSKATAPKGLITLMAAKMKFSFKVFYKI